MQTLATMLLHELLFLPAVDSFICLLKLYLQITRVLFSWNLFAIMVKRLN